jgi:uncharacterized protein DUF3551
LNNRRGRVNGRIFLGVSEPAFSIQPSRKRVYMRIALAALILVAVGPFVETAKADPYRWCAEYSGGLGGGGTNCYFITLEQCRAAVSGVGGFCVPNNFYDGRPVVTPDGTQPRKRR